MLTELKVGDEISTAGGLLGKIIKVGESYIQLKISDNVDIKLQKSSVNKILPKNSLESIK
jgi:preprotein translocase subunit YajC